jgi:hypothetical protein
MRKVVEILKIAAAIKGKDILSSNLRTSKQEKLEYGRSAFRRGSSLRVYDYSKNKTEAVVDPNAGKVISAANSPNVIDVTQPICSKFDRAKDAA